MVSQASHALARSDLTITFADAKEVGKSYRLSDDGNTPVTVEVDRAVEASTLDEFRRLLASHCVEPKPFAVDKQQAPGGYTALVVTRPGDDLVWVSPGPAQIEAPGLHVQLEREAFSALIAAWPPRQGE
jgi:hypothetical protein